MKIVGAVVIVVLLLALLISTRKMVLCRKQIEKLYKKKLRLRRNGKYELALAMQENCSRERKKEVRYKKRMISYALAAAACAGNLSVVKPAQPVQWSPVSGEERAYANDLAEYPIDKIADSGLENMEKYIDESLFFALVNDTEEISDQTLREYNEALADWKITGDIPVYPKESSVGPDRDRLDEIDREIKSYKNPAEVPCALYMEEYQIRKQIYEETGEGSNAYQTARAADDTFSLMQAAYNGHSKSNGEYCVENRYNISINSVTLFAAFTVNSYCESLQYEIPDESRNDIYLKIAIIFRKLYATDGYTEEEKRHFLLVSYVFLHKCSNYGPEDNLCCEVYNYYMGTVLFDLGEDAADEKDRISMLTAADGYLQKYVDEQLMRPEESRKYVQECRDDQEKIRAELRKSNEKALGEEMESLY